MRRFMIPRSLHYIPSCYIANDSRIEESKAKLLSIGCSHESADEIITFCKSYSYSLSIPNTDGFKIMFNRIYSKLSAGKSWSEIKETMYEQ